MNLLEIIDQLESLREHCSDYVDVQDPECVWNKDIEALCFALTCLRFLNGNKYEEVINYVKTRC